MFLDVRPNISIYQEATGNETQLQSKQPCILSEYVWTTSPLAATTTAEWSFNREEEHQRPWNGTGSDRSS